MFQLKCLLLLVVVFFVSSNYTLSVRNNIIKFELHDYSEREIVIGSKGYSKFTIDNSIRTDKIGYPDLPVIRKPLLGFDLSFEYKTTSGYERETNTIISVRDYGLRCGNRTKAEYLFSDVYYADEYYPSEIVSLKKFYSNKGIINGYMLEINPISYNPFRKQLIIIHALELELFDLKSDNKINVPTTDYNLFEQLFLNFKDYRNYMNKQPDRILIISANRFYQSGVRLTKHKQSLGHPVVFKQVSEISPDKNSSEIKAYIKELFNEEASLKYTILIGNENDIPMMFSEAIYSKSDAVYGQLTNETYNVNVFVSRITGKNSYDVDKQLDKIFKYQPNTTKSYEVLGIASDEIQPGVPTDCDLMRRLHKMINLSNRTRIFNFELECDPIANKEKIKLFINKGMHFVDYIGHGNGTRWVTSDFNTTDAYNLLNNYVNPIIIDVSCNNGNLPLNPCLAESLLASNEYGSGALSMYSSIPTAEWIPPVHMQYFAHYILHYGNQDVTVGQMAYGGTLMACVMYPGYSCKKLTDGYILYGDGSLLIKNKI